MFSAVRSMAALRVSGRRFLSKATQPDPRANVGTKNAVMAVSIAGFVGFIYYTAINKMREVRLLCSGLFSTENSTTDDCSLHVPPLLGRFGEGHSREGDREVRLSVDRFVSLCSFNFAVNIV